MKRRVYIFTTFVCTLRCPRCYQLKLRTRHSYMLSMATFRRILIRLDEQAVPIHEFVFTGGEPTCWPDLTAAIALVKSRNYRHKVRVVTNGYGRKISDYGDADAVQVSDYGAINRIDCYRLKRQGGRRVRIQSPIHWDWDPSEKTKLPGECGCTGLSFVGDKVWPCAMAAAAGTDDYMGIDSDFGCLTGKFCKPHYQDFCRGCLVNRRNRKSPRPVLQVSLWESASWIFGAKSK